MDQLTSVKAAIEKYGTTRVANELECPATTVDYWRVMDRVPGWRRDKFVAAIRNLEKAESKGA
jgi:hypothetical protein